ncbi:serine/threonine protein phosphatase [Synechococcus sp. PCC 7502]|uniref:protein phosphatase 2C domain-containing protein n=1 Tax=Synechococcus sp. PCC 7502 TaxID=1173263 RepID=UPI00029FFA5C|nr:protein phosphatase 2C domain-containing protein [Synechococcus sp. PCC 7502]AFY72523.1 serine/threonine protein phosphatase [Synechococcus sp. PCC 7502]
MIKCSACGFDNPDVNKFCQNCGIEIITSENSEDTDPLELANSGLADSGDITSGDVGEDVTDPELCNSHLISLKYAALSDVGKEREHNEDGFRCFSQFMTTVSHSQPEFQTHRGLFILCDGMGGHDGGEVASAIALESIAESFKPFWTSGLPSQEKLTEIIGIANQEIYDRNEAEMRRDAGRMGTTLVILVIYGTEVAIAHIGDSRIYKITADGLTQLTRDHEVANRLIDQGVSETIAYSRGDAHQLTQALGPNISASLEPAIAFFNLDSTSLFLLCSDGLSDNNVVEDHWQQLQSIDKNSDLSIAAQDLIQLGNDLNGYDNITAVLVHCQIEQN